MSPIVSRRNHPVLGGSVRQSKATSATEAPSVPKAKLTLADIFIVVDEYEFPREGNVPAGYYFSEVKDFKLREKPNGAQLLDVMYEIEGYDYKNSEQVFHIKQAYPLESDHLKKFFKAMVDAGVKNGSNIMAAVGVTERIKLAYVSDTSDFGSIDARIPYNEADYMTTDGEDSADAVPEDKHVVVTDEDSDDDLLFDEDD